MVQAGHFPGVQYPRVPGHEAAGVIDELGAGVTSWKKGQRVGIGWYGGDCGGGNPRPRGGLISCAEGPFTRVFYHRGGAGGMGVGPPTLAARPPQRLSAERAAPRG